MLRLQKETKKLKHNKRKDKSLSRGKCDNKHTQRREAVETRRLCWKCDQIEPITAALISHWQEQTGVQTS